MLQVCLVLNINIKACLWLVGWLTDGCLVITMT